MSFRRDERPIADLPLGYEWKPSLADVMKDHPWPDSEFQYSPPTVMKAKDGSEQPLPDDFDFEAFRVVQLAQWKDSMSVVPTPEAKTAWAVAHAADTARARNILRGCDVEVADDINRLGCTGVVAHPGFEIDDITFLRMALAGSGCGLPCFVPPTRFCLAHNTIGGLERGQKQCFADQVDRISRPLTQQESTHVRLTDKARRSGSENDAFTMLSNAQDVQEAYEDDSGGIAAPGVEASALHAPDMVPYTPQSNFVCIEHEKKIWSCRYCVAEMIVQGALMPQFRILLPINASLEAVSAAQIDDKIAEHSESSVDHLSVYVEAAKYRRKLARD